MIRHAEAEGNIYRRAHGQFNGQIIGRGFAQIEQLKDRFRNEKIDAVYSSDLSRTITTAAAISKTHGLPVNTTERLREVNVGEWEDIAWGEIRHRYPQMAGLFNSDPALWNVDGSEEYSQVRERMRDCLKDIGLRHDNETVAVFSHGFATRSLLCELMDIPSHMTELVPYCDNTAVALLHYENNRITIQYHGDNSHLLSGFSTFAKQTWWRDEEERRSEDLRYLPFDEDQYAEILNHCSEESHVQVCANIRLIAALDDHPAGILGLDTDKGSDKNTGWISQLYIKPELRRKGFGIQLLGQAVSEFRRLRRDKLQLEVPAYSPAMNFCARYGFSKIGALNSTCLMEKDIRNW